MCVHIYIHIYIHTYIFIHLYLYGLRPVCSVLLVPQISISPNFYSNTCPEATKTKTAAKTCQKCMSFCPSIFFVPPPPKRTGQKVLFVLSNSQKSRPQTGLKGNVYGFVFLANHDVARKQLLSPNHQCPSFFQLKNKDFSVLAFF